MDRKKIAVTCGACLAGILLVFLLAGQLESGQKKNITRQTESSVIGTETDELKTDQPDQTNQPDHPDQTIQDRASVGQAAAANGANRQLSPGQTGSVPAAVDSAQADAQKETPAAVTDTSKSSKTGTDKSSSGNSKTSKSKSSKSKTSKSKTAKSTESSKSSKSSDSEDIRIVGGNNKTNQGSGPLFEGEEKVILPSESLDPEQTDPKKDPQDNTQSQPQPDQPDNQKEDQPDNQKEDEADNQKEDEAGNSGKESQPSDDTTSDDTMHQPENPDHHSDDREGIQLPILLF